MTKDSLSTVLIEGETFFKISNHDAMSPFLMSIVSDSNHWMFISSNGGLSAGRKDADHALFPYYTDDKLSETQDITGSKSIFWVTKEGEKKIWEPFAEHHVGLYQISRNLYKNHLGNKVLFEEINHDLGLTFKYQWSSSNIYGFVRSCTLINDSDKQVEIELLDGIQNILPHGVSSDLQTRQSNLVDAYKKCELEETYGLGIYSLSSIIVDRAEPSEALKANIAWSTGLLGAKYLITSKQIQAFRKGESVRQEIDEKASKGAYFVTSQIALGKEEEKSWMIIANVNQSASTIAAICEEAGKDGVEELIHRDVQEGCDRLRRLVASADGLQLSEDGKRNARHYSNTLFNIMRGGIFDNNYQIEKWDFINYLSQANIKVANEHHSLIHQLPDITTSQHIISIAMESGDQDLIRLAIEYLPLKFSRRHGDPSRPWNRFSINTRSEIDGSKILDYEGNWRDIFQNWEALVHSYPEFIDGMILKFLNASTFDGYNPYRVTKGGFDWETIEPHDPWSYIGYWGDHQVIYLLKFLEFIYNHDPAKLAGLFDKEVFVYANVPYKIKPYEDLLKDPKDTIIFDEALDHQIRSDRDQIGADGGLLKNSNNQIHRVNFVEKILVVILAKLSNFIPEGGIWMNTQRPEWNDANNALVGNGVSMVTLYYLRRFFDFFRKVLDLLESAGEYQLSEEVAELFSSIVGVLTKFEGVLSSNLSDHQRKEILDGLGHAGSQYRDHVYAAAFSGRRRSIEVNELKDFVDLGLKFMEHTIRANKREDGMYHAYNILSIDDDRSISIGHLQEMLEGQVAVLSSGYLSPGESLSLLDALKQSKLFREDQYSYILYPDNELPRFLAKNVIPESEVMSSSLLSRMIADGNTLLVERDINGQYHFNGNFNNAEDLKDSLVAIASQSVSYEQLVRKEQQQVLKIFESVFNHKAFTGRSGTFYGYEGLGSIYWHMVSKLLLAVMECYLEAVEKNESEEIIGKLVEHYYEINEGIGYNKSPELYGAFPMDPYSHTPSSRGVQQPGMTGQVKEDILSRIGELGVFVREGCIHFDPTLLRKSELLESSLTFDYVDVKGQPSSIDVGPDSVAFTYCQVPVIYQSAASQQVEVYYTNGESETIPSLIVSSKFSEQIFSRTGEVAYLKVGISDDHLR